MNPRAKLAIVSTSLFRAERHVERARAQAAIRGLQAAQAQGAKVFLVDGGSDEGLLTEMCALGATIVKQSGKTLGAARRQAIALGARSSAEVLVYTEIEKDTLIEALPAVTAPFLDGRAQMVVPERRSMQTYPEFQRESEKLLNKLISATTGVSLDYAFGPRIFRRADASYFLNYDGRYGDSWDSIFIPVLRAIASGMKVVGVPVDYINPPEQTLAEEQQPEIMLKRAQQLYSIGDAVAQEWQLIRGSINLTAANE